MIGTIRSDAPDTRVSTVARSAEPTVLLTGICAMPCYSPVQVTDLMSSLQ
jgi:hypothetical protein